MPSSVLQRYAALAILVFSAILTLYPVAWMLSASLKESREIFGTSLFSFGSAGFKNYVSAFSQRPSSSTCSILY